MVLYLKHSTMSEQINSLFRLQIRLIEEVRGWGWGLVLGLVVLLKLIVVSILFSAQENYAHVKAKYGDSSCYMLQINSCPGSPSSQHKSGPDVWSHHMRTTHTSNNGGEVNE